MLPSATSLRVPTLEALKPCLKALRYRKTASLFVRSLGEVIHLVEMQGSHYSTAGQAVFTVNVGVYVPRLVPADVRDTWKPRIPIAHWRERLGFLGPERRDMWWEPTDMREATEAASDIVKRMQLCAQPVLDGLADLKALTVLWESGRSAGITEKQRLRFLNELSRDANAI